MTFYFYDLETSGFDARYSRIMQFAGQRTDEDLNPVGDPQEMLIKLDEDIVPDPGAILVTGITPQKTHQEGYSEAEFVKLFEKDILKPNTVFVGYNSIRFDDEFMRHLFYRNFRDSYEWQWKSGRSRWDLLDVSRMMRALRPEGIKWPTVDGKPSNKLEQLTKENDIEHSGAHDALADVRATIDLAKLIKSKQPKLYDYLLKMRSKDEVKKLVSLSDPKPFVYCSGRYPSENNKTTVVIPVAPHPINSSAVLVYDLRHDPTELADHSAGDMIKNIKTKWADRDEKFQPLPIKPLAINKAPAIAPLGVLDDDAWKRINLDLETVKANLTRLKKTPQIAFAATEAWESIGKPAKQEDVEGQLYDGFLGDKDKKLVVNVAKKEENELADYHPGFVDERLSKLLLRYKARNFPKSLSAEEKIIWRQHVLKRIEKGIGHVPGIEKYFKILSSLAKKVGSDQEKQFLLEELRLYGESILPESDQQEMDLDTD